jgi:hypothetical protein
MGIMGDTRRIEKDVPLSTTALSSQQEINHGDTKITERINKSNGAKRILREGHVLKQTKS